MNTEEPKIDRRTLVQRHNPIRTASNITSPMQVGNGHFAFGVDITGLQTFVPFATMSDWGWKNDKLPLGKTLADYQGVSWDTHGRSVRYDMPSEDKELSQWMISNPNRVNLVRIGLHFGDSNIREDDLVNRRQVLDLWTSTIHSSFEVGGSKVSVETIVHPDEDTIGIKIDSSLILNGELGIFLDFPFNDGSSKFSAPYVGDFDRPESHITTIECATRSQACIRHNLDDLAYCTNFLWNQNGELKHLRDHRYFLSLSGASSTLDLSVNVSMHQMNGREVPLYPAIAEASQTHWQSYWKTGGIIDLSQSSDPRWFELERRIILSLYVMAVNATGRYPPQESGLVNVGWYGKFHMEMAFWHMGYLALFNKWTLLKPCTSIYDRFLQSATELASSQGYKGARWPKMTDPSGRMAPGEINSLLIWQQPHPLFFAELEYRAYPATYTLHKWKNVVFATADFMSSYAKYNASSGFYDLGPPLHVISENTDPRSTYNPAFELEYWRYGLSIAQKWRQRLGLEPEVSWSIVMKGLGPTPIQDGLYVLWPGVENMWTEYTWEHPSLIAMYGWLPGHGLDLEIMKATTGKIWNNWKFEKCWGWDFSMLAMNAARSGNPKMAVGFLLDENLHLDDVGLVRGTTQVPTPYFPGNGGLLYAVAFMAAGWDGAPNDHAPGFPSQGWKVRFENLNLAI